MDTAFGTRGIEHRPKNSGHGIENRPRNSGRFSDTVGPVFGTYAFGKRPQVWLVFRPPEGAPFLGQTGSQFRPHGFEKRSESWSALSQKMIHSVITRVLPLSSKLVCCVSFVVPTSDPRELVFLMAHASVSSKCPQASLVSCSQWTGVISLEGRSHALLGRVAAKCRPRPTSCASHGVASPELQMSQHSSRGCASVRFPVRSRFHDRPPLAVTEGMRKSTVGDRQGRWSSGT